MLVISEDLFDISKRALDKVDHTAGPGHFLCVSGAIVGIHQNAASFRCLGLHFDIDAARTALTSYVDNAFPEQSKMPVITVPVKEGSDWLQLRRELIRISKKEIATFHPKFDADQVEMASMYLVGDLSIIKPGAYWGRLGKDEVATIIGYALQKYPALTFKVESDNLNGTRFIKLEILEAAGGS